LQCVGATVTGGKTAEQHSEQTKVHDQQVLAGQTRRLKQLEAEMVTQRSQYKRSSAECEGLKASLQLKEIESNRYQKEARKFTLQSVDVRDERSKRYMIALSNSSLTD